MDETSALLVVDMQIDFCPGGSLAVDGGDTIIPVINRYMALFGSRGLTVFATRDWHLPVTRHFRDYGGLWPSHCIQGSPGARFHPDLKLPDDVTILSKGMDPTRDDYSSFHATLESGLPLSEELGNRGITDIYICGLATDYCIRETALDAMEAGFSVTVLRDAVRGVDRAEGDSDRALAEIARTGGRLADLAAIEALFRME